MQITILADIDDLGNRFLWSDKSKFDLSGQIINSDYGQNLMKNLSAKIFKSKKAHSIDV